MATRVPGGYNPAAVAITGGTIQLDNGSKTAPSYSFASATGVGAYWRTANTYTIASGGVEAFQIGTTYAASISGIRFSSGDLSTTQTDSGITRFGPQVVGVRDEQSANSANEFRVYAGNGGFLSNVKSVTESLTIAAAATTVSATTIPAGAILLAVSVRVTTVIPTAATFTVTTTTGGTTLNTAAVSSAANSTDAGTAAGASYRAASTTVTITPNLTPGAATGVVRLQYYYLQVTPATS